MQEATTIAPGNAIPWDIIPGQSLLALLALVGTKRMEVETLRERTKLAPINFVALLAWLQHEYLVDIISGLEDGVVKEEVRLTDLGEAVLVTMLERTCELPELR